MATPPIELNERRRQDALIGLGVLDTLPEPVFDAITSAAAEACGVPIALVSLVDADRQWFKSNIGLPGVEQTPRDVAFCDHTIRGSQLLEVPSAENDARFAANPLVTGDPHIRFYAGAPIELPSGERVGTVCVIDREPRQLTQAQRALLVGLGRVASAALVDRQRQLALSRQVGVSEARYRAIVEDQSELISLARPDGVLSFVNQAYARHYGMPAEQMVGLPLLDFVAAADRAAVASRLEDLVASREIAKSVNRTRACSGDERWVEWTNRPLVDEAGRCTAIHSVGRDVTEQHLAELRLREALHEKDTLLKEVYHRVKNNLQLVQSLLNLQHRGTADAAAQSALAESARRIRAMALVHEKLYQSRSLVSIALGDYARDLLRHIGDAASTASRGIEIQSDITDIDAALDAAIPFGLLLNELVFNALEHAFEGGLGGRVSVSLDLHEGVPLLRVQDDGAGLKPGFSCSQGAGMGLQLATSLATQLGGALLARSTPKGGAEFTAQLPGLVRQAT